MLLLMLKSKERNSKGSNLLKSGKEKMNISGDVKKLNDKIENIDKIIDNVNYLLR